MKEDPTKAQHLSVEAGGFSLEDVDESWEHHRFNAARCRRRSTCWCSRNNGWRSARTARRAPREQLATLIDTSVYQEALALEPRQ